MVRHKTEQELYNNKKTKAIEEEDWIRVENTHPAIIDKILFEQVECKLLHREQTKRKQAKCKLLHRELMQRKQVQRKRLHRKLTHRKLIIEDKGSIQIVNRGYHKKYSYDENIVKNKIFCGECKAAMTRVNVKAVVRGEAFIHKGFSCGLHRKSVGKCSHKETIKEDVLCSMINKMLVDQAKLYHEIRPLIRRNGEDIFNKERFLITADKKAIISVIKKNEEARFTILEEYHQGMIDKSQVVMRRGEIQGILEPCKEQVILLEKQLSKVERLEKAYSSLMYAWIRYTQNTKITKEIIPLFVKRIDVYSGKRVVIKLNNFDYVKDRIEVYYKEGV